MGDQLRGGDVTDAAASVVAYATYCAARDAGREEEAARLLHGIADYNEYDCLSTLRLHEFLLGLAGRPTPPGRARRDRVPRCRQRLGRRPASRARAQRRRGRAPGQAGRRGAGGARRAGARWRRVRTLDAGPDGRRGGRRSPGRRVGYYWREAKPFWQEYFARLREPVDEWQNPRAYFLVEHAEVVEDWARATPRSNPSRRLRLYGELPDGSELKAGHDGATALFEGPSPDGIEPAQERAAGRRETSACTGWSGDGWRAGGRWTSSTCVCRYPRASPPTTCYPWP
ncbi:hypothetical protein NKG05_11450 [Oerskovia sp. M15]